MTISPITVLVVLLSMAKAVGAQEVVPALVYAGIAPQAWLVERVGGDRVRTAVMVPQGQDPHTFEPSPRHVADLGRAKLYIVVGMPFEARLLPKIRMAVPDLVMVDGIRGVRRRLMECDGHGDGAAAHRHGVEGEFDPHAWLSAPNLVVMASNICVALTQAMPSGAADFERNRRELTMELETLHAALAKRLAPFRGRAFYVYHPAFGYFADDYGLRQAAVEIEGKSPTPRQIATLVTAARRDGVRIIFVQPQFSARSAQAIAEAIGGVVVALDPLARDPLRNFGVMASELERAFGGKMGGEL
jgi:zinc transport system substrate-binding protein